MPQPAASDRMRRLLAQSPKVVESRFHLENRTLVGWVDGVAQTQRHKLKTLAVLCVGASHRFYEDMLPPLAYSAWIGRPDLVQIALAHYDKSVVEKDLWDGYDALSLAVLSGDIPTVDVILQRLSTPRAVAMKSLQLAAKSDNDEMFPFLYRHQNSYTYLRKAPGFAKVIRTLAGMERTEMLRQVLDLAQLTCKDLDRLRDDDRRDLFRAASTHKVGCLRVLLSYQPIARNSAGTSVLCSAPNNSPLYRTGRCTPMLFAASCRAPVSVVDALISGGASVDSVQYYNQHKFSPLDALVCDGLLDMRASALMVQKLVHAGARLDDRRGSLWGSALDGPSLLRQPCPGVSLRGKPAERMQIVLPPGRPQRSQGAHEVRDERQPERQACVAQPEQLLRRARGRGTLESPFVVFALERDASVDVSMILVDFLRKHYPEYRAWPDIEICVLRFSSVRVLIWAKPDELQQ
ncbi:hypothetical protein PWT90_04440 [Aphanocladium album]|nr:hypothetical protein PWT90_04440 [Aphanocladium album]